MIFVVNPNLFSYTSKLANPFEKIQLHTLDGGKRIATIMTDRGAGQEIDNSYVNIRTRSGEVSSSGDTEVLIRSCSTNKYDGNFIIAAIPFNGVLLPTIFGNFRFRYAEIVEIGDNFVPTSEEFYPEGMRYTEVSKVVDGPEKILYCVIEPNTSVMFDQNHPKHAESVYINIPFASYDEVTDKVSSNTNFRITLSVVAYPPASEVGALGRGALKIEASYAPRKMHPKVMSKLHQDVLFQMNAEKNLPYPIFFQTVKKDVKNTKTNKKPTKTKGGDNFIECDQEVDKYAGLGKRNKSKQGGQNQNRKPVKKNTNKKK